MTRDPAYSPSASPSSSHWGAFGVRPAAGGIEVIPHPADPAPSPLLGNIASALRHPSRVRRPAVRRGWLEHGPGPCSGRGQQELVEVSWDRALDLAAAELDRVRSDCGSAAIYGGSYGWASAGRFHHAQSQLKRLLNLTGGFTSGRGSYSHGTSDVILPHVVGDADAVLYSGTSWPAITQAAELIVAFGGLPEKNVFVSAGGQARHDTPGHLAALAARGVRVALVSPLRGDLPDVLEKVRWYPLVPATDTALMLGLAHTLAAEGRHDRAFLDRYCAGYDRFERYLDGRADGVARDADWAAAICGISAADIRDLARQMAGSRTLVTVTWSLQRIRHGEQPLWAGIALAAMLGQIGLPGGGFGHGYGSMGSVGSAGADVSLPRLPQGVNPVRSFIPVARIADLLLHPGESFDYDGQRLTYPDIRLVYWAGGNPFHHHQDLGRLRRAFARPDTVIVHEPYWTATARHADIVFPVTTALEREDVGAGRRDSRLIAMHQAVEPVGEARDDYAVLAGLAARLGVAAEFTQGRTAREWLEHLYEEWRGQQARRGHEVPPFAEFWAAGEAALPSGPAERTLFEQFRADPAGHPLRTPSGRIELFSDVIAGFGYPDCPGHPAWLEPQEWLGGPRARQFPLHLIANQPSTRLHSQLDVGEVSQRAKVAGREAISLHPGDAAARGIAAGDVVRVFNDRGACLAGAVLTDAVRPGVARLPTGAWFDPVPGPGPVLCAHGNPNAVTADVPSSSLSQGSTGQHVLVQVERYAGEPPPVTAGRPPRLAQERGPVTDTAARPWHGQLPAVTQALARRAAEHDRAASYPADGIDAAHAAGLLTATVGTRHGGPGGGLADTVAICRALGAGDPSVALICAMTLLAHGLQDRQPSWPEHLYAAALAESARRPVLINTLRVEPELGTPSRGGLPATTARRVPGGWELTGRKIFSTGAPGLRWMVVWARTDDDPPLVGSFLVRSDAPGITIEPTWDHLGLRASRSDDVSFAATPVPGDAVTPLAPPAPGPPPAEFLAWNALSVSAIYLGVAAAARDWLARFLTERTPTSLGRPLATLPRFQSALGEIEAALTAAGHLVTALAAAADDGDEAALAHAGIGKLTATRAAIGAVEQAVALIGNNALTRANPLERHLRDVLCARVHTPQDDTITLSAGRAALAALGFQP